MDTVHKELELLTGKAIVGDITPVVYELVREYKEGVNVHTGSRVAPVQHDVNRSRVFEQWLRRRGEIIAVQHTSKRVSGIPQKQQAVEGIKGRSTSSSSKPARLRRRQADARRREDVLRT